MTFCSVILVGETVASGQAEQRSSPLGEAVNLRPSTQKVGRFERIEFPIEGVPPPETSADICPANLVAEIRLPSGGRVTVPAFWYQPYQRRTFSQQGQYRDWLYPSGKAHWLVRFAPWELGVHQVRVRWEMGPEKRVESPPVEFECLTSQRRGFLRCSTKNPRFFATSEGRPFFAVGQNLAFVGGQQYFSLARFEETLPRLAGVGVNYLRIWTCCEDWALCIEGRKSAWTRTWHWKLPVEELPEIAGLSPGRKFVVLSGAAGTRLAVEPSWPVAVLPDTEYLFTCKIRLAPGTEVILDFPGQEPRVFRSSEKGQEWTHVHIKFRSAPSQFWLGVPVFRLATAGKAWLDELSLREAGPDGLGPELLWEADVNRPERGFYNPVDCAILDFLLEAAERAGIYLQLCMLTRDLYMWALKDPGSQEYDRAIADARRFFRHAIARWGYSTAVGAWEYWNEMDPGRPTERFYNELGQFFEENDPYHHLRTTSTWHPSSADMNHPRLDIADLHFYLRPVAGQPPDEVEAVLRQARFLRQHAPEKPALISEFGLATEKWGLSDNMKADQQAVHVHNALWASALSGVSGTVMFWWWEQLDLLGAYPHYGPVSQFAATISWEDRALAPFEAELADGRIRLVGLKTPRAAWCWLINREATWVGSLLQGKSPQPVSAGKFVIEGLNAGTYHVEWMDPWDGSWLRDQVGKTTTVGTRLSVQYPRFVRDLACRVIQEEKLPRRP
jgi:hypothetical protein